MGSAGDDGSGADQASGDVLLELRHAAKSFGAVHALADGRVKLRAGEAHALLGENGAGSPPW